MILTENGVLKLMQRIKSFITAQLNTKASSVHTHSISEIENLESQLGGGYSKSEVDTLLNDYIPKSGGAVISGTFIGHTATNAGINYGGGTTISNGAYLTVMGKDAGGYFNLVSTNGTNSHNLIGYSSGVLTWSGDTIGKPDDTGVITLSSGTDGSCGGQLNLYGKNHSDPNLAGAWLLQSFDGTNRQYLVGYPSGDIINHGNGASKHVAFQEDTVPRSGGSVLTGEVYARNMSTSSLFLCGDTTWDKGACLILRGELFGTGGQGFLYLRARSSDGHLNSIELSPWGSLNPSNDNYSTLGLNSRRWTTVYSSTSSINTSDLRLKNTITNIDDNLLDAWENIEPKQYKFNDATESKGEQARFHTGYIAQDIEKACNDNNIDATRYGLFCYDSWEEEPEISEDVEVEKDGIKTTEKRIVQQKREKGDMYALRYEEALVVECAYLRRENNRLKERLNKIENLLNI